MTLIANLLFAFLHRLLVFFHPDFDSWRVLETWTFPSTRCHRWPPSRCASNRCISKPTWTAIAWSRMSSSRSMSRRPPGPWLRHRQPLWYFWRRQLPHAPSAVSSCSRKSHGSHGLCAHAGCPVLCSELWWDWVHPRCFLSYVYSFI